jgi:hypothetical protein
VIALFCRVEAAARDIARASIDAELGEGMRSIVGDRVSGGSVVGDEHPAFLQRVCDGDAEPTGEMVVATAGVADGVRTRPLPKRSDRLLGRDACDGLEELGDLAAGEVEVSVPPARNSGDQAGLDESREVMAGGGCRNACLGGQDACRQRSAVGQREQDLRSGRLGQQRADGSQIGISGWLHVLAHSAIVTLRFFDLGRKVLRREGCESGICCSHTVHDIVFARDGSGSDDERATGRSRS